MDTMFHREIHLQTDSANLPPLQHHQKQKNFENLHHFLPLLKKARSFFSKLRHPSRKFQHLYPGFSIEFFLRTNKASGFLRFWTTGLACRRIPSCSVNTCSLTVVGRPTGCPQSCLLRVTEIGRR